MTKLIEEPATIAGSRPSTCFRNTSPAGSIPNWCGWAKAGKGRVAAAHGLRHPSRARVEMGEKGDHQYQGVSSTITNRRTACCPSNAVSFCWSGKNVISSDAPCRFSSRGLAPFRDEAPPESWRRTWVNI